MDDGKFFDAIRAGLLGPVLTQSEVDGCNAILAAMNGAPLAWTAYAFGTAYHETWHTMQPIKEAGGDAYFLRMYDPKGNRPAVAKELGNVKPGDGALYCGRGYVQLTGRGNYAKAAKALGVDLVGNPDLALHADVAAQIMRRGMTDGWFTGKGFTSYLPDLGLATVMQFTEARWIVNGQDSAAAIAQEALSFQTALQTAGYGNG